MIRIENVKSILNEVSELLDTSSEQKILVIGDVILDKYTYGETNRVSSGISIPIIDVTEHHFCLGGAGNIAANISGFVDKVSLMGTIGCDDAGKEIMKLCDAMNIDTTHLSVNSGESIVKERVYVSGQQLYRLDGQSSGSLDYSSLVAFDEELLGTFDVVIIADYNLGFFTEGFIQRIIKMCRMNGVISVATTRSSCWNMFRGVDHLALNTYELKSAVEFLGNSHMDTFEHGLTALYKYLDCSSVLVTRGEKGLVLMDGHNQYSSALEEVKPVNVTGAGDSILAVFAIAARKTFNKESLGTILNIIGQLAVLNEETYVLSRDDLIERCYLFCIRNSCINKVISRESVLDLVSMWKNRGKRIVFTNGCFDILHIGHIKLLREAKKRGEKLIVALNSDDSIKRLKGPERPINKLEDRLMVLASLEEIDCILVFDDETAVELVSRIQPDVYVKGAEYKSKVLPEAAHVKKIEFVDMHSDMSTSGLIGKIIGN